MLVTGWKPGETRGATYGPAESLDGTWTTPWGPLGSARDGQTRIAIATSLPATSRADWVREGSTPGCSKRSRRTPVRQRR